MPGTLNTVSSSVADVSESRVISRAYVGRYDCGMPYPALWRMMATL